MKEEKTDWLPVCERLRERWNCYDFQHFINGFKRENPRHLFKQLSAVEQFLDAEAPPKSLVSTVMNECCREFRYQFSQFKAVYDKHNVYQPSLFNAPINEVQRATLDRYQQAFLERCGDQ
jgi:hypothetical protein